MSYCRVNEHVKNYRPKLLVLSGPPASRPDLVDFANLITKKISLLSSTHIIRDPSKEWPELETMKSAAQTWYLEHKVKAFHAVTRNSSFLEGVRAAIELQGLGKLSPNMLMLGFKEDWREDLEEAEQYLLTLHMALDMHLSVGMLRMQGGFQVSEPEQSLTLTRCASSSLSIASTDTLPSKATHVMAISVDSGLNISSTPDLR